MISILTNEAAALAAREFFELFKTPWEFHRAGAPADILLCAGGEVPSDDAALLLIFGGEALPFDAGTGGGESTATPGWFEVDGLALPIYGRRLVDPASGKTVCRRGRTQGRPFVRIGFDLFGEIRHLLTAGQPVAHAAVPTLEQHAALVRGLILEHGLPLVEIPPRPAGHEFIACLTHDVDHAGIRNHKFDHTMFGFLYRATAGSLLDVCAGKRSVGQLGRNLLAALRLPLVQAGLARDFWVQFEQYTALEAGRPSTYYVIPKKGEAGVDGRGRRQALRAARYEAADLREILQRLERAGKEVGVHGLEAWRDSAAGRDERSRIGGLVGQAATGIRMHWLYFDEAAPGKLEAAGFLYDSTVGYNETVGYRAGTGQVFKPFTARQLLELPLHIMDTALFYPSRMGLSPRQAQAAVQPLIENARRFGGVLTINWHDRSLAPERLWGGGYTELLGRLEQAGAWFATAAQTVAWFRRRRAATFTAPAAGRVRISLPAGGDDLPALRVRVHRPGGAVAEEMVRDGWETGRGVI